MICRSAKATAVFCERWHDGEHRPGGVISESAARRRDARGRPYVVVLGDQERPDALIEVNWSMDFLGTWFLDDKLRRNLHYSFTRVDAKTLFLEQITLWEYPEDAVRDLNTATKVTTLTYNEDGVRSRGYRRLGHRNRIGHLALRCPAGHQLGTGPNVRRLVEGRAVEPREMLICSVFRSTRTDGGLCLESGIIPRSILSQRTPPGHACWSWLRIDHGTPTRHRRLNCATRSTRTPAMSPVETLLMRIHEAAGKPIRIHLHCVQEPTGRIATVVQHAASEMHKLGIGFVVNVRA